MKILEENKDVCLDQVQLEELASLPPEKTNCTIDCERLEANERVATKKRPTS